LQERRLRRASKRAGCGGGDAGAANRGRSVLRRLYAARHNVAAPRLAPVAGHDHRTGRRAKRRPPLPDSIGAATSRQISQARNAAKQYQLRALRRR
jgi:hypothetical protein